MKKFTKLFLSCAAVTAVTAAVATSAMAAVNVTGDLAGTYEAGKLTLTTSITADTATILVLKPKADDTAVKDTDILYIDQVADGNFGSVGLLGAPSEDDIKGAKVKVGYYATAGDDSSFTVLSGTIGAGSILIGDADQDTYVDGGDATAILKYNVGKYTFEGNGEAAADADQDTFVDGGDATAILKYNVGKIDSSNDKVGTLK